MELLELLVLVRRGAVDREVHRLGGDPRDVRGGSEIVLAAVRVLEHDAVEDVLVGASGGTAIPR